MVENYAHCLAAIVLFPAKMWYDLVGKSLRIIFRDKDNAHILLRYDGQLHIVSRLDDFFGYFKPGYFKKWKKQNTKKL